MPRSSRYERPQIFEIGNAAQLTRGLPLQPYVDDCNCSAPTKPVD